MGIIYRDGDVIAAPERILIHGCNNRGVMNSGVAKAVRAAYPQVWVMYRDMNMWALGYIGVVYGLPNGRVVINAITQSGYGYDGKRYVSYDALVRCFEQIAALPIVKSDGVVCMPKIGAGLGGGKWEIIAAIIEATLGDIDAVVYTV